MMTKFCSEVLVVAFAAGVGTMTSRAGLLSDYPFDGNASNLVVAAPRGTLVNGPVYVAGKIGAGALSFNGVNQYVDITPQGFPNSVAGMKTGSATFWMKSTAKTGEVHPVIGSNMPGFQMFEINLLGDKMNLWCRASAPPGSYTPTSSTGPFNDGNWHQVTWTWNVLPTGEAGVGGTSAVYLDGVLNATPNPSGTGWAGTNTVTPWNASMRIGGSENSYYFQGALDDMAIWSAPLTATEARAVYNLGNEPALNYSAKDIDALFTVFDCGRGCRGSSSDGKTWAYTTGLKGLAGDVVNQHTAVILDGNGNGVAILPGQETQPAGR